MRQSDSTGAHGPVPPCRLSTGHVTGWWYYSEHDAMEYLVLGPATVWELAPHAAARVRWANGNETVTTRSSGHDPVVAPPAQGASLGSA